LQREINRGTNVEGGKEGEGTGSGGYKKRPVKEYTRGATANRSNRFDVHNVT